MTFIGNAHGGGDEVNSVLLHNKFGCRTPSVIFPNESQEGLSRAKRPRARAEPRRDHRRQQGLSSTRRPLPRFIRYMGGANVRASRISLGSPGLILASPEPTEAPGCCQAAECD